MKRALIGLAVGGLIAAAGTIGFFFGRQPATPPPSAPTEATPTPAIGAAPVGAINPTATPAASQTIQDSAGLYSITLPQDWQVTLENARGVRISGLTAQSPDYEVQIDEAAEGPFTPVSYKTGASLQITVLNEPLAQNPQPAGVISEQKPIVLDGVQGTYFVFKEPSTAEGQLLEVRLEKAGRSYHLRWGYNPATLAGGQTLYENILRSFRFLM